MARIRFPSTRVLTRALLSFWAIWFSIVAATNAGDGLLEAGLLPADWRFASGNFGLVAEALSFYSLSQAWAAALFALVLILELAAASLFWRATLEPNPLATDSQRKILSPFFVGIGLFCAFLVFDEALLVYRRFPNLESGHFAILSALLLSLLLIRLPGER